MVERVRTLADCGHRDLLGGPPPRPPRAHSVLPGETLIYVRAHNSRDAEHHPRPAGGPPPEDEGPSRGEVERGGPPRDRPEDSGPGTDGRDRPPEHARRRRRRRAGPPHQGGPAPAIRVQAVLGGMSPWPSRRAWSWTPTSSSRRSYGIRACAGS